MALLFFNEMRYTSESCTHTLVKLIFPGYLSLCGILVTANCSHYCSVLSSVVSFPKDPSSDHFVLSKVSSVTTLPVYPKLRENIDVPQRARRVVCVHNFGNCWQLYACIFVLLQLGLESNHVRHTFSLHEIH